MRIFKRKGKKRPAILSELRSAGGGAFSSRAGDTEVSQGSKGQEKACIIF